MTPNAADPDTLSHLMRARRSVRDFLPDEIPLALLNAVLEDANGSPELICGLSIGQASGHAVNQYNPGRGKVPELLIGRRRA
jgi:nitroreductase